MKRAIVLLSGGLDSAAALFYAKSKGYKVFGLVFNYGQRHKKEVRQAQKISKYARCPCRLVKISLPWKGSALLDKKMRVPKNRRLQTMGREIPLTYVPARNIIFLSFAASYAEAIGAQTIFIGANTLDYSGYPDCRPEFFQSFARALKKGSKAGVEGRRIKIETPLISLSKAEIIKLGLKLKVPYYLTWSCYEGKAKPCGRCDSCLLRQKGFDELKIRDPLQK